jgi:UDP-hydrolysing UDP-N-acetyl-D-glucosamine 2-epimerase
MKVAIFSTSRAEFGILEAILQKNNGLDYFLFIGGMHLLDGFGDSLKDTEKYVVTDKFDFFCNIDTNEARIDSLAKEFSALKDIFCRYDFDSVLLLGDRFELLPIVQTAMIFNKAIIHIHGGEVTEGAIDEQIRHMITKASHIHFPSCKEYEKNIRNMGEEGWRIHNVGALALDNIINLDKISKDELFKDLALECTKKTVLVTYHPVTLEFDILPQKQLEYLFTALSSYDFQIVITAPNIDSSYSKVFEFINSYSTKNNVKYIKHLGMKRYLSLIPFVECVIGNSSSGITEVPYFKIPTINIGDRQKGRIRHLSIIDTDYSVESIKNGIDKALDANFRNLLKDMKYKFGDGHAAEKIIKILKSLNVDQKLLRKKLEFSK